MFYSEVKPNDQLRQFLESKNMEELIEYGDDHPKQRQTIRDIMVSKYKINHYLIKINQPITRVKRGVVHVQNTYYYITKYDLAVKFLKMFGDLLTKIEFDDSYGDVKESWELLELINQQCPNLIEASLPTQWRQYVKEPFYKVEVVSISSQIREFLDLDRIFPNMVDLRLMNVETYDPPNVVGHYKHLTRLTSFFYYRRDKIAEAILKANPQINYLDLHSDESLDVLQELSTRPEASNIETLYFYPRRDFFDEEIKPLLFKRVKNFIVVFDTEDFVLPSLPFQLPSLDNITTDNYSLVESDAYRLPNDWYSITDNPNLKTILMAKTALPVAQVCDFSKRFGNLNSFTFKSEGDLCNPELIECLESATSTSIKITGIPVTTSCDALKKLSTKWFYLFVPEAQSHEVQSLLMNKKPQRAIGRRNTISFT